MTDRWETVATFAVPNQRHLPGQRQALKEKKGMGTNLDEVTDRGHFRAKVEAIIRNGRALGFSLIVQNALRTVEQQRTLVDRGYSRTMRSKHLGGSDGKARAVDIVDAESGWDAPTHVWVMIGRLALTQGCDWGGLWGLPQKMRHKFEVFLLDRSVPFDPTAWKGKIGWDPAHVQARGNANMGDM